MSTKKREAPEAWAAIEEQARRAEMERFASMPKDEVDARLRAAGLDPERTRAEGAAMARKLAADRDRLAWQVEAAEGLAKAQAAFDARPSKYEGWTRDALAERLEVVRKSPKLAQPVAVMFRNRKPEEASADELRELLEEIEALEEGDGQE
jgi:hypothetical protein